MKSTGRLTGAPARVAQALLEGGPQTAAALAERLADHVVIVDHGLLVAEGAPADLTAGADALTFTAPGGLDLTALSAALPPGCVVLEPEVGRYRVEGDVGPSTLSAVADWCAAQGVLPRDLSSGRRSLEDVFLELTGRQLRP